MFTLEDLLLSGLKVYQDDEYYRFTSDSVLLSKFVKVKKNDVVADFCSGSGIVGFHLYGLNENLIKSVTFFEMQKSLCDMCVKSIEYNNLSDKFSAVNVKIQDIPKVYNEKFSLIVCNPPYMEENRGENSKDERIAMCKVEKYLPLKDLVKTVARCLKFGGRVNFVYRADRLSDIFWNMKQNNIEPKKMQFVSGGNKPPYLVMVEGVKGGKPGLKVLSSAVN